MKKEKRFRSKFGYEIIIFVITIFVSILVFMIYKDEPFQAVLTMGLVFAFMLILITMLFHNTIYTIKGKTLFVDCSFLYRRHIEIELIKSINKTNSPMSAPAASLDRLALRYGEYGVLVISPKDKIAFVNELKKINPKIEIGLNLKE